MSQPSPIPFGPWTDPAKVREVLGGTVLETPIALHRRGFEPYLWRIQLVSFLLFALSVILVQQSRYFLVPLIGVGIFWMLLHEFAGYQSVAAEKYRGLHLLVGPRGFAEWQPRGATVVFWCDLGVLWHLRPPTEKEDDLFGVLEHATGVPFPVRRYYPQAEAFFDLIRDRIRENQQRMPAAPLPPEPKPAQASPTTIAAVVEPRRALSPHVEPGPWSDSAAARAIGPLLLACGVSKAERATRLHKAIVGTVVLALLSCALLGGLVLECLAYTRGQPAFQTWWPLALVVALIFCLGGIEHHWRVLRPESSPCWLVGERGVAFWSKQREVAIPWAELAQEWRSST